MALLKLRRHLYFVNVDSIKVTPVSAGRFEVTYDEDRKFIVVGGRASGGSAREWFVYHPHMFGDKWVPCKSMIEAIRTGATY